MNIQDALPRIFPQPTATVNGRGGSEVNGLPRNTVPQNCEIVLSGLSTSPITKRQEHYLVRIDSLLVFLRVCSAYEGSGYDEYAVIRNVADTPEKQAELLDYARRSIQAICGQVREGSTGA